MGAALLALGWLASGPAIAHGGPLAGRSIALDDEGALIGASTTWGLVVGEQGCAQRVCEEVSLPPTFTWFAAPDRVFIGTEGGLKVTTDHGCTFLPADNALDLLPVVLHDAVPGGRVAAVATSGATPERVWVSYNGGERFMQVFSEIDFVGERLTLVPAGDEVAMFFSGKSRAGAPRVYISHDHGGLWELREDFGDSAVEAAVLGAAHGARCLLAITDDAGRTDLVRSDVMLSERETAGVLDEAVTDAASFGDRDLLIAGGRLLSGPVDAPLDDFEPIAGGPTGCLQVAGGRVWGCADVVSPTDPQFLVSDDGITFTAVLAADEVTERGCPDGTLGKLVCEDTLGLAPPSDGAACSSKVPPPVTPAPLCGCTAIGRGAPGALAWLLLLPLLSRHPLARPPRRRQTCTRHSCTRHSCT